MQEKTFFEIKLLSLIFQVRYGSLSQKHTSKDENQRTNFQDLNVSSIQPHVFYHVKITVYLHHSYNHTVTHNYKRKIECVHICNVVLALSVEEVSPISRISSCPIASPWWTFALISWSVFDTQYRSLIWKYCIIERKLLQQHLIESSKEYFMWIIFWIEVIEQVYFRFVRFC